MRSDLFKSGYNFVLVEDRKIVAKGLKLPLVCCSSPVPNREPTHILLAQALVSPRHSCSSSPPRMQCSTNLTGKGAQAAATYVGRGGEETASSGSRERPQIPEHLDAEVAPRPPRLVRNWRRGLFRRPPHQLATSLACDRLRSFLSSAGRETSRCCRRRRDVPARSAPLLETRERDGVGKEGLRVNIHIYEGLN
jgi:hypothetical protein